MPKWSQPFSQYYMSTVNVVIKHLGWWELQQFQIDRATTNQSEAFSTVMKRLQNWKEAPIDSMALSLLRLTDIQLIEIKRGLSGLGNYSPDSADRLRTMRDQRPRRAIMTNDWRLISGRLWTRGACLPGWRLRPHIRN